MTRGRQGRGREEDRGEVVGMRGGQEREIGTKEDQERGGEEREWRPKEGEDRMLAATRRGRRER